MSGDELRALDKPSAHINEAQWRHDIRAIDLDPVLAATKQSAPIPEGADDSVALRIQQRVSRRRTEKAKAGIGAQNADMLRRRDEEDRARSSA